eukprot:1120705-Prymnesium_polylepis.1
MERRPPTLPEACISLTATHSRFSATWSWTCIGQAVSQLRAAFANAPRARRGVFANAPHKSKSRLSERASWGKVRLLVGNDSPCPAYPVSSQ